VDRSRPRPEVAEGGRERARKAAHWTERARAEGRTRHDLAMRSATNEASAAPAGETSWYERFHAYQRQQGKTSARDVRYAWLNWVSPRIGKKSLASVTRDDIENAKSKSAGKSTRRRVSDKPERTGPAAGAAPIRSCVASAGPACAECERKRVACLQAAARGDMRIRLEDLCRQPAATHPASSRAAIGFGSAFAKRLFQRSMLSPISAPLMSRCLIKRARSTFQPFARSTPQRAAYASI
jgi:hypothetical protein